MSVTVSLDKDASIYARRLEDLRQVALTADEIAAITGVQRRQVYHWQKGEFRPRGEVKEHLLDLHYVVEQLLEVYSPEGVDVWLHGRNRDLGGRRPIEVLKAGEFSEVLDVVERLKVGAF